MNDIDIDSPVIDVNNYDEAMSYYKENGYVILTPLVTQEEMQFISEKIDTIMGNVNMSVSSSFAANDFILKVPEIVPIIFKEGYVKLLKLLLGAEYLEIQHSKYNAKNLKGGSKVPVHQDFPYFPHTDDRLLAFNFHLDGSNRENGGMYCYAGKWNKPLVHTTLAQGTETQIVESEYANNAIHHFVAPPGSVSIHSSFLPHASNDSNGEKRRMPVYQLRHPLNKQIGGAIWKCTNLNPETLKYNQPIYQYRNNCYSGRKLWNLKNILNNFMRLIKV